MKDRKIALILIALLTTACISAGAQGILFRDSSLTKALAEARTTHRPVMLFCYASWCAHCNYMKEEVLSSEQVGDFYNKHFICIQQDMEKGEGPEMNKEIQIHSYPTFLFYDSDGSVVYRIEGEYTPNLFVTEGKYALNPKLQLPYLKTAFEKDSTNSDNCYNYLRALKKGGLPYDKMVDRYFATQSDKQLLSEVNWRIFTNGISDFDSRVFRFVIAHQKEYASIASPTRLQRKFVYETKALLMPLIDLADTTAYKQKRETALRPGHFSTDSLVYTFDLMMWGLNNKWAAYRDVCIQHTTTFSWKNQHQLAEVARNFLTRFPDKESLEWARKWAEQALSLEKNYDNLMLCAQIAHKQQDTKQALNYARKASELARKAGWEGTEALKLINETEQTH